MLEKYFVSYFLHDISHDPAIWSYKINNEFDDIDAAEKSFYTLCGSYINDAKYDCVTVLLTDYAGNSIESKNWIKKTPVNE